MPDILRPMTEAERLTLERTLSTMPQYAGWLPAGMEDHDGFARFWIVPPDYEDFL